MRVGLFNLVVVKVEQEKKFNQSIRSKRDEVVAIQRMFEFSSVGALTPL